MNVRGLSNAKRRKAVFTWLRKQNANIFLIQETHSTKATEPQWKSDWRCPIKFAHGKSYARGVVILFKGFDFKIEK